MSIIDYMRYLLINYPKISDVCNTVNIDFVDSVDDSYGLSSMGDVLIKRDVVGNQTRQHNFMLYATYQSVNDFDRLNNSGVLLDLAYYLDSKNNDVITTTINGEKKVGIVKSIKTENGSIVAIPEGNMVAGVQYQLQLSVTYEIESEV